MNASQYAGGTDLQPFHQDVTPILQQFAAKFTSSANDSLLSQAGLVVMGNDGVRYHCTAANPATQHYHHHQSNSMLTNKQVVIANAQHNSFVTASQMNQTNNTINNQCYTQNNSMLKTDASTMTEKEAHNETFLNQLIQQECNKPQIANYTMPSMVPPHAWQSLAGPAGSTVAEYLSRLPASTLPYTLHHFLKFSNAVESATTAAKKEEETPVKKKKKRKYKKKPYIPRPPRPKPGEIRLTTALDGSTLYCCPDCQMAYPEKALLEQHIVVHRLERRFLCNICGAGLKRKEHLDRHKQGHNPERPFVCTVCLKAFKRNEHLSRHFIIHSGDKSQACTECGKAFFRKDHLRKHAQSHIAKRLRTELMTHSKAVQPLGNHQNLVSLASMVAMGSMAPPPGISAVALMPGGATVPILSS